MSRSMPRGHVPWTSVTHRSLLELPFAFISDTQQTSDRGARRKRNITYVRWARYKGRERRPSSELLSTTLAVMVFQTFGDRLDGSPEAIIDAMFNDLAVWSDKPRWAGSGFCPSPSLRQ